LLGFMAKRIEKKSKQVFTLDKAQGHELYGDQAHSQVHLAEAFIPVKLGASYYTYTNWLFKIAWIKIKGVKGWDTNR
jgi:hypothetical protein